VIQATARSPPAAAMAAKGRSHDTYCGERSVAPRSNAAIAATGGLLFGPW